MSEIQGAKTRLSRAAVGTLFALCLTPAPARADDRSVHQKAIDGVVVVMSTAADGKVWIGTGVMVMKNSIVTAEHVVRDRTVEVVFPTRDRTGAVVAGRRLPCLILGTDRDHDLALLLVPGPDHAKPLPLAKEVTDGESVFSIGSSGDSFWHRASGNVTRVYQGKYTANDQSETRGHLIETSVRIDYGDSGSPILNQEGELVGIILAFDQDHKARGVHVSEIRMFALEALFAAVAEGMNKLK